MANIDERYKRGKIYTIRCRNDDCLVYVGSTIQSLAKRIGAHRTKSKQKPDIVLYKYVNNDWDKWYIELYEDFACNSKNELERREGEVIRQIGNLNHTIAGRDDKQYYQDNRDKILERHKQYNQDNRDKIVEYYKQYTQDNRDKIAEYKKQYYQDNRDKIVEYYKQYNQDNREKRIEQMKQYHQDNRDKILERKKQKCKCDICGAEIKKGYLKQHQRSAKCMNAKKE